MRVLSVIVIGAALAASAPAAELYEPAGEPFVPIAASGRAQAQIVVPAKPTFLEEYAASELQAYLEKISAARLPIADPSQADRQAFAFFLGNTEQAERLGIQTDEQTLGRDGFVLRSVPGGLVVIGRNDLGTLFGVYELLERYFGVRWFMPGQIGEHVPKQPSLTMGQVDLTFKPSFRVRWVGNGQWPLRQRMNAYVTAGERRVGINWSGTSTRSSS